MKTSPLPLAIALALGFVITARAQTDLFWNPSPLTGNWTDTAWASSSGGSPSLLWTSGANATFDQAAAYTVTVSSNQTAGLLNVTGGNITISGSRVTVNSINIGTGAALNGGNATIFRASGATPMTINGTLRLTDGLTTAQWVSSTGGTGAIVALSGSALRVGGGFNFAGSISGTGSLLTQSDGNVVLGGNNTYSGDTLLRHNGVVRLDSTTALSSSSYLRFANSATVTLELAAGNFARTLSMVAGGTNMRVEGNNLTTVGFAAIGGNRSVALNSATWSNNGTADPFAPAALQFGNANATHTATLTTNLNLGGGNRSIGAINGSAEVGGRISGNLTNGNIVKTGTGTLALSGSNSFASANFTYGTTGDLGAIRLESNNALGGITTIIGSSGTGNASVARIELANNVAISGIEYQAGGRGNGATTGAAIVNISGNNTWAGNIRIANSGGSYGLRSDAGRLTLSGTLSNSFTSNRSWTFAGAGDFLVSGNITNGGVPTLALIKQGAGTLQISGSSNSYSGGTTVSAGTLLVSNTSGSATGSGAVSVAAGARLGGSGSISGDISIAAGAVLAPGFTGSSAEDLTVGNVSMSAASEFVFNLTSTSAYTQIIGSSLTLAAGTYTLTLNGISDTIAANDVFTLFTGAVTGFSGATFTIVNNTSWAGGFEVREGSLEIVAVPEPGTWALLALSGVVFTIFLRRRRALI